MPMLIAALFLIVNVCKQLKHPSMDEWKKKMQHTHTHTQIGYHSTLKSKEILSSATTWNTEDILLNEISQRKKDKCHTVSLMYRIWAGGGIRVRGEANMDNQSGCQERDTQKLVKGYKFSDITQIRSEILMYNMMTTVDNTIA